MKAQEPVIPTWQYKMVASMEAVIFNCHCDQMQNCEGGCETIYLNWLYQISSFCHLQMKQFRTMHGDGGAVLLENFRPTQELYGRMVYRGSATHISRPLNAFLAVALALSLSILFWPDRNSIEIYCNLLKTASKLFNIKYYIMPSVFILNAVCGQSQFRIYLIHK